MLSFSTHVSDHRKKSMTEGSLIPLPFIEVMETIAGKSLVSDDQHDVATLESSFVGETPHQINNKHIIQCLIAIIGEKIISENPFQNTINAFQVETGSACRINEHFSYQF